jgi:vitamin B12 transporter
LDVIAHLVNRRVFCPLLSFPQVCATAGMNKIIAFRFNHRAYLWRCLTVSFYLVLSADTFAQSDTTKKLNQVSVNASAVPAQQAIIPTQTVNTNDFVKYNALNVADAVRNFSGVIIKDYGGIGGLKTISVRGLGANHTAILYDGIQINEAENGQVDLSKLNLTNTQQITIYNAQPPNLLQTARAFAAASVLSIETTKPNLTADKPYQITAGIKTGSFGLFNPYLQYQQRLDTNWAVVFSGYTQNAHGKYTYFADDGAIVTKEKRTGSEVAIQQVDGALIWNTERDKLNIHINYYNSDRGVPGAVIQHTEPTTGQKLYNRDLFFQGSYQHNWTNGLQLLVSSKFAQNQLSYFDPDFLKTGRVVDQRFSQREYYQSAALVYHIRANWSVSYSSDIAVNNINANLADFRYPTRVTLLNVLATNVNLGDWTLQGNLVNADIKETVRFGTTIPRRNIYAPTIIASIKPFEDKNLQLRAFYKYAFRVPTFNDQYYNYISNPDLQPEFASQYDVGASYTKSLTGLLSYISLTADAYYNYVTNKLVFIPSLYNGYTQNAGKVDIKGLDIGLKTMVDLPSDYKLNLTANYSYQQALYVDDKLADYLNRLPYIPLHTMAINAGISKGRMGVYYNQILSSSRYYENNSAPQYLTPAYSVSDASFVYRTTVGRQQITAVAGVNNVFDKHYDIVRSYPMPGRSIRISFQITI